MVYLLPMEWLDALGTIPLPVQWFGTPAYISQVE
jgi:hypothetical protein